ncbi:hypothetical protein BGZ79_000390 [Entomortierella chlamydospora]|nr:hypothetical protein BGZ79_000390 [Entomortierella chlamydospora]
MAKAFHGQIEDTLDALIILEGCRQGILPKINRRLLVAERGEVTGPTTENSSRIISDAGEESSPLTTSTSLQSSSSIVVAQPSSASSSKENMPNPSLITPGSVFVFDEEESGICRWTDGRIWSPSRICGNFLVYRELFRKLTNEKCWNNSDKAKMRDGSGIKDKALKEKVEKDNLVVLGCMKGTFVLKKDGLIKKTICVRGVNVVSPEELRRRSTRGGRGRGGRRGGSSRGPPYSIGGIQHLVCYEKSGAMDNLHRPREYVELLELPLSRTFITKQKYRNPIHILPLEPGEQPIDPFDEYVNNRRIVESRPAVKEAGSEQKVRGTRAPRINKRKTTTVVSSSKNVKSQNAATSRKKVDEGNGSIDKVKFEANDSASDSGDNYNSDETTSDSELDGYGRLPLRSSVPPPTTNHSYPTRGQNHLQQQEQEQRLIYPQQHQRRRQQRRSQSSLGRGGISSSDTRTSSNVTPMTDFTALDSVNGSVDILKFPSSAINGESTITEERHNLARTANDTFLGMPESRIESQDHHLAVHGLKSNGEWRLIPTPRQFLDRIPEYASLHHDESSSWQSQELQAEWTSMTTSNDHSEQGTQQYNRWQHTMEWRLEENSENFDVIGEGNTKSFQNGSESSFLGHENISTIGNSNADIKREHESPRATVSADTFSESIPSSPIPDDWSSGSLSSGRSLSSSLSLSPRTATHLPNNISSMDGSMPSLDSSGPSDKLGPIPIQNLQERDGDSTESSPHQHAKARQEACEDFESRSSYSNSYTFQSDPIPPLWSPNEFSSLSQQAVGSQSRSPFPTQFQSSIPPPEFPQVHHTVHTSQPGATSTADSIPFPRLETTDFATQSLYDRPGNQDRGTQGLAGFTSSPAIQSNQHDYMNHQSKNINGLYFGVSQISTDTSGQFSYNQGPSYMHQGLQLPNIAYTGSCCSMQENVETSESSLLTRFPLQFLPFQDEYQGYPDLLQHSNSAPPGTSGVGTNLGEFAYNIPTLGGSSRYAEQIGIDDPRGLSEYMGTFRRSSEGSVIGNFIGSQNTEAINGTSQFSEGASEVDGNPLSTKRRKTFGSFGQYEASSDPIFQSTTYQQSIPNLLSESWVNLPFESRNVPSILDTSDFGVVSLPILLGDTGNHSSLLASGFSQSEVDAIIATSESQTQLRPTPKTHFKSPSSYLFPEGNRSCRAKESKPQLVSTTGQSDIIQLTSIKTEPINDSAATSTWEDLLDISVSTPQSSTAHDVPALGSNFASQSLYFNGSERIYSKTTSTKLHGIGVNDSRDQTLENNPRNENNTRANMESEPEHSSHATTQTMNCQYGDVNASDMTRSHFMSSKTFSTTHQGATEITETCDEDYPDPSSIRSYSNTSIGLGKDEYLLHTQHSNLSTLSQQQRHEEENQVSQSSLGEQLSSSDLPSAMCHQLNTSQDVLTCLSELQSHPRMLCEPSSSDTQRFSDPPEHHVFEDDREQEEEGEDKEREGEEGKESEWNEDRDVNELIEE